MKKLSNSIKTALTIALATWMLLARPTQSEAVATPAFPVCPNPSGQLIANYDAGVHGIAGDPGVYVGSDQVFKISDTQIIQCFCPTNKGEGIQTVWWKYTELSTAEVDSLIKQGWIWIPTGSVWGLDDASYLAKNTKFRCSEDGGNGGTGGGSSSDSGSSSGSSSSSGGIGGAVLGISTLANTGSQANWLALLCLTAVLSLSYNIIARHSLHN